MQTNVAVAAVYPLSSSPVHDHAGSPYVCSQEMISIVFTNSLTVEPLPELVLVPNVPLSQVRYLPAMVSFPPEYTIARPWLDTLGRYVLLS